MDTEAATLAFENINNNSKATNSDNNNNITIANNITVLVIEQVGSMDTEEATLTLDLTATQQSSSNIEVIFIIYIVYLTNFAYVC